MQPVRHFFLKNGAKSGGALLGAGWLSSGSSTKEPPRMVKISDLPVYEEQTPASKQAYYVEPEPTPILEQQVSKARRAVTSLFPAGSEKVRDRISDVYETGKAHSQTTLGLLRDDTKVLPRAFAISTGGLLGFLAAYRRTEFSSQFKFLLGAVSARVSGAGGMFRKILYTSLGLGAAATICYPRASRDVVNVGFTQIRDLFKGFEKHPPSSTTVQSREDPKLDGKDKRSH